MEHAVCPSRRARDRRPERLSRPVAIPAAEKRRSDGGRRDRPADRRRSNACRAGTRRRRVTGGKRPDDAGAHRRHSDVRRADVRRSAPRRHTAGRRAGAGRGFAFPGSHGGGRVGWHGTGGDGRAGGGRDARRLACRRADRSRDIASRRAHDVATPGGRSARIGGAGPGPGRPGCGAGQAADPDPPGASQADAPVQPASAASVAAQREPDSASLTSAAPAADAAPAVDGTEHTAADPVGEAPTATPAVSSARPTRDLIDAAAVAAETRGRLFEESGGGPPSPLGRWRIGGPTPSAPPYEAGRRAHVPARTATVSGDAPGVAPLHVAEVVRVTVARPSAAVRVRAPHRGVELPAHRDAIRWPPFARVAAPIALVATLVTAWLGRRRRRIAAVPPAPTRFSPARCSWERVEPSRSPCRAA